MIDVRSYEGSPHDLAAFVQSVWRTAYQGKMAFPLWTADYLSWQLPLDQPDGRDLQLAAYVEGRLAGVLLAWPFQLRCGEERRPALLSSWLSVVPEFRGLGIVKALKVEQDRRMAGTGDGVIQAFRYFGSKHSMSKGPTAEQLASGLWESRRSRFRVRILHPRCAAAWYVSPAQRLLTLCGAPFTRTPSPASPGAGIRSFEPGDAPSAARLMDARAARTRCSIDWTPAAMLQHCQGFGKCLVSEEAGQVTGLVAWHELMFVGATTERVAIIDIIATEGLPDARRRRLLNAALSEMRSAGAIMALKLETGDVPASLLWWTGFIPWVADSFETLHTVASPLSRVLQGPHHLLWR